MFQPPMARPQVQTKTVHAAAEGGVEHDLRSWMVIKHVFGSRLGEPQPHLPKGTMATLPNQIDQTGPNCYFAAEMVKAQKVRAQKLGVLMSFVVIMAFMPSTPFKLTPSQSRNLDALDWVLPSGFPFEQTSKGYPPPD